MLPSPQPPKGHFLPQWSSLQAGLQQLKYSAAFLRVWDLARRLQVLLKKEMQDPLLLCLTYYGHGDLQAALDLTFCYKKNPKIKNQTNKEGHKPIWFPFAVILMSSKLGSVPPHTYFYQIWLPPWEKAEKKEVARGWKRMPNRLENERLTQMPLC